jgi:tRNA(Ile)-lysidine synthase
LAPLIAERIKRDREAMMIDPSDMPRELKRRLLLSALAEFGATPPRGPDLIRAMDMLEGGGVATLSGLKMEGGPRWRISHAPPRRIGDVTD